tara:strand:+ start:3503 stop:3784 length:282 start_codon:yes stop_codon:yes gene_type:complete
MSELGDEMSEFFSGEYYGDYPQFTDMILRWNKACDLMGSRKCIWVLRVDMKHTRSIVSLNPDRYSDLLRRLRIKYHEVAKFGKLKDPKKEPNV